MNITDPEDLFALSQAVNGNLQLGSITQNIAEANDAGRVGALVIDGVSGDENFPWGKIKPLYTVGEINMCEENHGEVVSLCRSIGLYQYLFRLFPLINLPLLFTLRSMLEFPMAWELT